MAGFENNFQEIQDTINTMRGKSNERSGGAKQTLMFEDASSKVKDLVKLALQDEMKGDVSNEKKKVFNKQDLRDERTKYQRLVRTAVYSENFKVVGFDDLDAFINAMVEELVGYSILSDAFDDPDVDDIFCISWDCIYVERNGRNEKYPKTFRSPKHYHDFIERVLALTGSAVNNGDSKIVDAEFYEDRIAVTSDSVTPRGLSMTIRKHREEHIKLAQIVNSGTMNQKMADLIGTMIKGESNLIYAGITGSGKTTSLRALIDHYVTEANKRMLVAEDTQELFPENEHTLQLVTSPTNDPKSNVSLRDLVMTALRLKPKYIIIGEVRGPEAEAAVEAMETGHSTIFTMHGGTPWNIIDRLVNKYLLVMPSLSIEVIERIIGASVDYVIVQDDIPGIGRRVSSISELSYDFTNRQVRVVPIMSFDFETEDFVFINKLSPEKGTKMMRRGIPVDVIRELVREDEDEYIPSLKAFQEKEAKNKKSPQKLVAPVTEEKVLAHYSVDDDDEEF